MSDQASRIRTLEEIAGKLQRRVAAIPLRLADSSGGGALKHRLYATAASYDATNKVVTLSGPPAQWPSGTPDASGVTKAFNKYDVEITPSSTIVICTYEAGVYDDTETVDVHGVLNWVVEPGSGAGDPPRAVTVVGPSELTPAGAPVEPAAGRYFDGVLDGSPIWIYVNDSEHLGRVQLPSGGVFNGIPAGDYDPGSDERKAFAIDWFPVGTTIAIVIDDPVEAADWSDDTEPVPTTGKMTRYKVDESGTTVQDLVGVQASGTVTLDSTDVLTISAAEVGEAFNDVDLVLVNNAGGDSAAYDSGTKTITINANLATSSTHDVRDLIAGLAEFTATASADSATAVGDAGTYSDVLSGGVDEGETFYNYLKTSLAVDAVIAVEPFQGRWTTVGASSELTAVTQYAVVTSAAGDGTHSGSPSFDFRACPGSVGKCVLLRELGEPPTYPDAWASSTAYSADQEFSAAVGGGLTDPEDINGNPLIPGETYTMSYPTGQTSGASLDVTELAKMQTHARQHGSGNAGCLSVPVLVGEETMADYELNLECLYDEVGLSVGKVIKISNTSGAAIPAGPYGEGEAPTVKGEYLQPTDYLRQLSGFGPEKLLWTEDGVAIIWVAAGDAFDPDTDPCEREAVEITYVTGGECVDGEIVFDEETKTFVVCVEA